MTLEELITSGAGVLLSLGFSYIPGVQEKFDTLNGQQKRLLMLALLVLVTAGVYSVACAGFAADFNLDVACDRVSAVGLLRALFFAATANQVAYALSPQKKTKTTIDAYGSSGIYFRQTVGGGNYHDADDFGVGGEPIDEEPEVQ
jgi:hypothetical protein